MDWLFKEINQTDFVEIRNTSLGKLVREQLLSRILRGELQPGQPLREIDIADELKVSRVPVREALRELESIGMVVSLKHTGVFVRELSDEEVRQLYEFRALLDSHAGKIAAMLPADRQDSLAKALTQKVEAMDKAIAEDNTQAYYRNNLQFHWLFIEATGNKEIATAYRQAIQKLHLARLRNLASTEHRKQSNKEHREIVKALTNASDLAHANHCAELMHHHVIHARERLQEL